MLKQPGAGDDSRAEHESQISNKQKQMAKDTREGQTDRNKGRTGCYNRVISMVCFIACKSHWNLHDAGVRSL